MKFSGAQTSYPRFPIRKAIRRPSGDSKDNERGLARLDVDLEDAVSSLQVPSDDDQRTAVGRPMRKPGVPHRAQPSNLTGLHEPNGDAVAVTSRIGKKFPIGRPIRTGRVLDKTLRHTRRRREQLSCIQVDGSDMDIAVTDALENVHSA